MGDARLLPKAVHGGLDRSWTGRCQVGELTNKFTIFVLQRIAAHRIKIQVNIYTDA